MINAIWKKTSKQFSQLEGTMINITGREDRHAIALIMNPEALLGIEEEKR